ncbi:MAG: insulinase family protein [Thermoanaerobaculia bacterium]|nr:insulinase family protein [Thermoanaerobaculia bacterium]
MSPPANLPPLGPERAVPTPHVESTTLPNGLAVQVVPRPGVPLVTVRLVTRGGMALDAAGSPGLARLLAASLREGTRSRTGAEIADLAQEAGGDLSAGAGPDSLTIGASGLAAKLPLLLDLVSDVARRPAFPEEGVERAKDLAHEDLETSESEPFFLAVRAFARAVYGSHPYGTIAPTAASIDAVTPEILAAEARRRIRPDRSLLLVAGAVDAAEVRREAERLFGDWTAEGEPPAPIPLPVTGPGPRRILVLDRPGSVQTNLLVGNLGFPRTDPDAWPLELATTIYGASFTSRLVQNLREEKGYTYSPGAGASWLAGCGTVRSFAAVRNEVTGAALNEILYEMERMATTEPADEEMERAFRRDAGSHAISLQTAGGVADELVRLWVLGLPPEEVGRVVEALARVTKADVRRASRRVFGTGAARIVAVGDAAAIREELATFGEVEVLPAGG